MILAYSLHKLLIDVTGIQQKQRKRSKNHMDTAIMLETEQLQKTERNIVMDVCDITKSLPLGRENQSQEPAP